MQRSVAIIAWVLALGSVSCDGRTRSSYSERPLGVLDEQGELLVFDISEPTPESTLSGGFFPLPPERTFAGLVSALEQAKRHPAPGYFVRFGAADFNWAQAEELGRSFGALRGDGGPVFCHGHSFSNASMWLAAAACDEIWLSPGGTVETVGIAGQSIYLKRLLERFDIRADFLHVGKYKSAAETLTQDGPSEAAEESMVSVLASMRQAWLAGIAESRTDPQAVGAAENGPWVPKAAAAIGLIDHIGYESDVKRALRDKSGKSAFESAFSAQKRREEALDISRVLRALTGADDVDGSPHIAVLPAEGGISMEEGSGYSQEGIVAKPMTETIRRLAKDDSVKAVVLRIDSPGGSALASDLLWHELAQLREKKPLIASVGSMAASGGYYLASAADEIVAERTSIVGSIGVVGGKIVLGHALDRFGVSSHTFAASDQPDAGARAAYLSVLTEWDDVTRQRVQALMDAIYELFLERVASGREMSRDAVHEVAQGRIWSGAQGHERGLVDHLGGLSHALEVARTRAGLPDDVPVRLEGPHPSLLKLLGLDETSDEGDVREALARLQAAGPSWMGAVSPHQRRYLEAIQPMLSGEHVLTVVPFAFEAR